MITFHLNSPHLVFGLLVVEAVVRVSTIIQEILVVVAMVAKRGVLKLIILVEF